MLERRGIVSGYEGSKPRRVLVDESQYHTYAADEWTNRTRFRFVEYGARIARKRPAVY